MTTVCNECPWRIANHGKRHVHGFYTLANLRRLWNGIRKGNCMSCHPTDPLVPEHGAKPGSKPRECSGSIILIQRELAVMADAQGLIGDQGVKRYRATRRGGLTLSGIQYWCLQRLLYARVPLIGGPPMPDVENTPEVGLPVSLVPRTV